MQTVVLSVPDISCEHCERTITETLTPVAGVQTVNVDIPGKRVHVQYDEARVDVDRMRELLAEEEYPVESISGA
jgi:copper chaperone CopZ